MIFIRIYSLLSVLILPLIFLFIVFRILIGKEDAKRIKERFGISLTKKNTKNFIWIHAVSVGESNSAMILVEEVLKLYPDVSILFTTTTITSSKTLQEKISKFNHRIIHQFLPIDSYFCIKKFFNFWQFKKIILIESEIWPNIIGEAFSRNIPCFLVNARMSDKSYKRWLMAKNIGVDIFDYFNEIFVQTLEDKRKFSNLSKSQVSFFGNLKSQATNLTFDEENLSLLKENISNRKVWLASSTHKGEEKIVISIHNELKKYFPDILTIIAIRHPQRTKEVEGLLNGLEYSKRSSNRSIKSNDEIYLVDTLGELGIFYRLVKFAFIGGSLVEVGGHNPFEAIKLDCGIISGNYFYNFKEIYQSLKENNSCIIVDSKDSLLKTVKILLENEDHIKQITKNAYSSVQYNENISQKIIEKIF